MQAHAAALVGYAGIAGLVVWRIYVRFKRAVGPQRLSRFRAPVTFGIYGLILLVLLCLLWATPLLLLELLAFLTLGALLAVLGLRKTSFEAKPGVLSYTPHSPIALSLAVLFVCRIAYRLLEVYVLQPHSVRDAVEFTRSPLTLGAFGLLAGYTLSYTYGLASWRRKVLAAKRAREARQSGA